MDEKEFWFKVITTTASALYGYHRFIKMQLDKKVDKDDCISTHKYIKEIRTENVKTLFKSMNKIEERLARIEDFFINSHRHE